jgi:uncharacterized phage-associated protein
MVTVHDVAAAIQRLTGFVDSWQMQKLAYYCQAWSLAWDDAPLFDERFKAWKDGPVVPQLRHASMWGGPSGDPANLDARQQETVAAVVAMYGHLTADQLVKLTHTERPWLEARGNLPPTARSDAALNLNTMRDYYRHEVAQATDECHTDTLHRSLAAYAKVRVENDEAFRLLADR